MINILDLALGILLGLYLVKNAGGLGKTVKSVAIVALILMAFGLLAQLVIGWEWTEKVHPMVEESLLFKTSHVLIRGVYPAIENTVPKVDCFIKDNIIGKPAPDTSTHGGPMIMIPKDKLPKLDLKDLPTLGD